MGVPAFFGWLTRKYPAILERCIEKANDVGEDGAERHSDKAAQINISVNIADGQIPKEEDVAIEVVHHEFDNFYIDMYVSILLLFQEGFVFENDFSFPVWQLFCTQSFSAMRGRPGCPSICHVLLLTLISLLLITLLSFL